jgi:hypothetical protein
VTGSNQRTGGSYRSSGPVAAVDSGASLGTLDGSVRATVDPCGRVGLRGRRWFVRWAVRGDEGWVVPERVKPASRSQRRLDGTSVVETSLRVPGGQAVHRAYGARSASGVDVAVVEIENRGRTPFGVALVVAGAGRIDLADRTVRVDREIGIVLPRPPSRTAASLDDVLADGGEPGWTGERRSRGGRAESAFVFPLAHTARLRLVLGGDADPGELPDADAVVAGWLAHLGAGLRSELPDPTAGDAVRADLSELLLAVELEATDVLAVGRFGHHGPAGRALWSYVHAQALHVESGMPLVALVEHWRATEDRELLDAAVGPVAVAAHRLRRRGSAAAHGAAAELLAAAGQPEAADLCRRRVAGPDAARRWDGATPAGRLLARRDQLVSDTDAGLVVVPTWPDEWLGQGIGVHRAPTRWGRLSFAVRWHGARPALLWERDGSDGVPLRTGLDASWSTEASRGEALLSPVEPAGGLPKVVAALDEPGTPVDEAAADGPGFT